MNSKKYIIAAAKRLARERRLEEQRIEENRILEENNLKNKKNKNRGIYVDNAFNRKVGRVGKEYKKRSPRKSKEHDNMNSPRQINSPSNKLISSNSKLDEHINFERISALKKRNISKESSNTRSFTLNSNTSDKPIKTESVHFSNQKSSPKSSPKSSLKSSPKLSPKSSPKPSHKSTHKIQKGIDTLCPNISAIRYYKNNGKDKSIGDRCKLIEHGKMKCLLKTANGVVYWATQDKTNKNQGLCEDWSERCSQNNN